MKFALIYTVLSFAVLVAESAPSPSNSCLGNGTSVMSFSHSSSTASQSSQSSQTHSAASSISEIVTDGCGGEQISTSASSFGAASQTNSDMSAISTSSATAQTSEGKDGSVVTSKSGSSATAINQSNSSGSTISSSTSSATVRTSGGKCGPVVKEPTPKPGCQKKVAPGSGGCVKKNNCNKVVTSASASSFAAAKQTNNASTATSTSTSSATAQTSGAGNGGKATSKAESSATAISQSNSSGSTTSSSTSSATDQTSGWKCGTVVNETTQTCDEGSTCGSSGDDKSACAGFLDELKSACESLIASIKSMLVDLEDRVRDIMKIIASIIAKCEVIKKLLSCVTASLEKIKSSLVELHKSCNSFSCAWEKLCASVKKISSGLATINQVLCNIVKQLACVTKSQKSTQQNLSQLLKLLLESSKVLERLKTVSAQCKKSECARVKYEELRVKHTEIMQSIQTQFVSLQKVDKEMSQQYQVMCSCNCDMKAIDESVCILLTQNVEQRNLTEKAVSANAEASKIVETVTVDVNKAITTLTKVQEDVACALASCNANGIAACCKELEQLIQKVSCTLTDVGKANCNCIKAMADCINRICADILAKKRKYNINLCADEEYLVNLIKEVLVNCCGKCKGNKH